jgi:hypothetical protein
MRQGLSGRASWKPKFPLAFSAGQTYTLACSRQQSDFLSYFWLLVDSSEKAGYFIREDQKKRLFAGARFCHFPALSRGIMD